MKRTKLNNRVEIFPCGVQVGITKSGYQNEISGRVFRCNTVYLSKPDAIKVAKWILKNTKA